MYAVEDVLDMRSGSSGREFLVRWEGCPGEDSWEPEINLLPSLVREYFEHERAEERDNDNSSGALQLPELAASPCLLVAAHCLRLLTARCCLLLSLSTYASPQFNDQ